WLGLPVDLLEGSAGKIGDVREVGVLVLFARMRELALLYEDRGAREVAVAPRVIGVEVAVRNELDVGDAVAGRAKSFLDRPHVHGLIEIDHLPRLRREARVEKENATRMLDDEGGDH